MANYVVTSYTYGPADTATVVAALEARIETVTDSKTIHLYQLIPTARDRDQVIGVLVYNT